MKKEHKSMNVDEEEMDEGKAKKGEPLAKRYGYADQQRVGLDRLGLEDQRLVREGHQAPTRAGG